MNLAKAVTVVSAVATSLVCPVIAHADALPPCQSGQVVVSAGPVQAAATHRGVLLTFALASYAPRCTLTGYPGVDTGVGGPTLHAERTLRGYLGGLPPEWGDPPTIPLSITEPAYAVVEGDAVDERGDACPTYTSLRITPPDNTDTQKLPVTIEACGLQVHPIGSTT